MRNRLIALVVAALLCGSGTHHSSPVANASPPLGPQSQATASAFNERGIEKDARGDYQGAINDFTSAIRLAPNETVLYYNRGASRQALGDDAGAIEDFSQAIRIDPIYPEAFNARGASYANLNDHSRAIADYSEAVRLNPGLLPAWLNRGFEHAAIGRYCDALYDYVMASGRLPISSEHSDTANVANSFRDSLVRALNIDGADQVRIMSNPSLIFTLVRC